MKEISRSIPNDYPNKKRLIAGISQNLDQFAAEHGEASFNQIVEEFGHAPDIAASFMEELENADIAVSLKNEKRKNRRLLSLCALIAAVALLLYGAFYYWLFHLKIQKSDPVYNYNGREVTYEEFMELQKK